jgi:hypothetical protein
MTVAAACPHCSAGENERCPMWWNEPCRFAGREEGYAIGGMENHFQEWLKVRNPTADPATIPALRAAFCSGYDYGYDAAY